MRGLKHLVCPEGRHLPGMAQWPEPWHCPAGPPGVAQAAGEEVTGCWKSLGWMRALTPVLLDDRPSDAMEAPGTHIHS